MFVSFRVAFVDRLYTLEWPPQFSVARLRPNPIKHAREWNRFPDVLDAAHPRGAAFNAHAESCVRHAAVAAQVEIPLERLLRQLMQRNLFLQKLQRRGPLAAANHFAIAFRRQHVDTQRQFRPLRDRAPYRTL